MSNPYEVYFEAFVGGVNILYEICVKKIFSDAQESRHVYTKKAKRESKQVHVHKKSVVN